MSPLRGFDIVFRSAYYYNYTPLGFDFVFRPVYNNLTTLGLKMA